MRKAIIILIGLILLAGCANTPDTVSIQMTVESAVSTAVAPYESRYADFVTEEDLTASQNAQNQEIQQYIAEQISRAMEDYDVSPVVRPESTETVYEDDGTKTTEPTEVSYVNGDCVDRFTYVSDITIPDGMTISPSTNFTKSWYITNTGECTWNSKYNVVYFSGEKVGTKTSFPILQPGYYVKPGESIVVSAELAAPNRLNTDFETFWAIESDKGEKFGSGPAKNVYLSSKFRVEDQFVLARNFGSITCSDDYGYFPCGSSSSNGGRGLVYYDSTPMTESRISSSPAVVLKPAEIENGMVRIEFGPLRFARRALFYTDFSCRPDTPTCDVQVRLYVRESGYGERLIEETREWNEGNISAWKFKLEDRQIYDQDFTYIFEVQANGGVTDDDRIMFWHTTIN